MRLDDPAGDAPCVTNFPVCGGSAARHGRDEAHGGEDFLVKGAMSRVLPPRSSKSKPKLPSLASILAVYLPPTRKSFEALGQCQVSMAKFHRVMCSGRYQHSQTLSVGAAMVDSIVIFGFAMVVSP